MKVAFFIFGKKWIVCHIWYIMKSSTYPGQNKRMKYMKISIFGQKVKILLLLCSIKIVNLWKTVLIVLVHRYSFSVSALHKKWSFPLRISPVNTTKSSDLVVIGKSKYQMYIRFSSYLQIMVPLSYLVRQQRLQKYPFFPFDHSFRRLYL